MKQVIAVGLGCAALFAGAAIGSSQVATPPDAATAQGAQSAEGVQMAQRQQRAMLRQLRQINGKLDGLRILGRPTDSRVSRTLMGQLTALRDEVGQTNLRIGQSWTSGGTVRGILYRICQRLGSATGCTS